MAERRERNLTVGVLAALALAILAFAIMAIGGQARMFVSQTDYRVVFPSSEGLIIGSPVKMAGVQVGTVRAITLPTDPVVVGTEVAVGVETKYASRVRADSRAALRTLQFVSGEKYVEILPGDATLDPIPAGGEIPLIDEQPLLEQGADIADNLSQITAALREILEPLRAGEGVLGEMIVNPDFGRDGLAALRGTLENMQALTARLRRNEGFVGRALHDPDFAATIDELGAGVAEFSRLMATLNEEAVAFGDLLEEGGRGRRMVEDLSATATALRGTAERLQAREGLVGRLLHDTEYSERLAGDLAATLAHLREIARKIDEGEGTLGALVNERVVADGLEEVVAGVGDSKFARWLIRHYRKKGIKLEDLPEAP